MRPHRSLLILLVAVCLGNTSVGTAQPSGVERSRPAADANVIDGRYIVVYDDTDQRLGAETDKREARLGFETTRRYSSALDGFAARLTPTQLRRLNRDPEVAFVSKDRRVEAAGYVPLAADEPTPPTGVRRINAATETTVREASGINVAVIDTGIQLDHPDLNAADGVDCVDPGTPASDENGHGTHVTGTIAAKNNGAGVVGVAPGTKAYAVRVLDASGDGTLSQVICGIDWVTANASDLNIRVANMSLGGSGPPLEPCATTTDALHTAICNSTAAGVNFAVAAGNDGWDFESSPPDTPAAYPEVLTVTAILDVDGAPGAIGASPTGCAADYDGVAEFSNYPATEAGRAHTIAAPGVCIHSTWTGSAYETLSGTSMAAPHVAGLIALCIDEAGTPGPCANLAPAAVIAELRSEAQTYNTTYPNYGFLRDPQHSPFPWSYGFLAVVPGAGAPSASPPFPTPPSNDDFEDAQDLGAGPDAAADGSNFVANKQLGEPKHAANDGGASVWYRWTAPYSGRYSINPCFESLEVPRLYHGVAAVYTGSSVASLTQVASTEFYCWPGELSFNAEAEVTYRIAIDGYREWVLAKAPYGFPDEGLIRMRLSALTPPPPAAPPAAPASGFNQKAAIKKCKSKAKTEHWTKKKFKKCKKKAKQLPV